MQQQNIVGTPNRRSTRNGWRMNLVDHDEENPMFFNLFKSVKSFYRTAIQELGWSKVQSIKLIMKMWINVLNPGGLNVRHNHPNCHLSGVFYIRTPPGSGILRIYSPQRFPDSMDSLTPEFRLKIPLKNGGNRLSSNRIDVQIKPGLLVLFPSYLVHEVIASKADTKRISFAFNISPVLPSVSSEGSNDIRSASTNSRDIDNGTVCKDTSATRMIFSSNSHLDMRAWATNIEKQKETFDL